MNEFNEVRIGVTDIVKMKLTEFLVDVMAFMSAHSSELLLGSLSAFLAVLVAIVLLRAKRAEDAAEELEWRLTRASNDVVMWRSAYNASADRRNSAVVEYEEALESWRNTYNNLLTKYDALVIDYDELESRHSEAEYNAAHWEEEYEDMRDQRDSLHYDVDELEDSVSELETKVETLTSMVDTYKELVDTLETTKDSYEESFLKLAA